MKRELYLRAIDRTGVSVYDVRAQCDAGGARSRRGDGPDLAVLEPSAASFPHDGPAAGRWQAHQDSTTSVIRAPFRTRGTGCGITAGRRINGCRTASSSTPAF
jgi:hypothetical protein